MPQVDFSALSLETNIDLEFATAFNATTKEQTIKVGMNPDIQSNDDPIEEQNPPLTPKTPEVSRNRADFKTSSTISHVPTFNLKAGVKVRRTR